MSLAVCVHAKATGRRRAAADHPLHLDLPSGPIPAAHFLEAVVRAEVAAYESRAQERTFLRVLPAPHCQPVPHGQSAPRPRRWSTLLSRGSWSPCPRPAATGTRVARSPSWVGGVLAEVWSAHL